VTHKCS